MRGITVILAIAVCLAAVVASTDGQGLCFSSEQLSSLLRLKQLKEKVCKEIHSELVEEVSFKNEELNVDNIAINSVQLERLADNCDVVVQEGTTVVITLRGVKFDIAGQWKKLTDDNEALNNFEVDVSGAKIVITLKTKTEECTIQDIQAFDCDLILKPRQMTISDGPKVRSFARHLIRTTKTHIHEVCRTEKVLDKLQTALDGFVNRGR